MQTQAKTHQKHEQTKLSVELCKTELEVQVRRARNSTGGAFQNKFRMETLTRRFRFRICSQTNPADELPPSLNSMFNHNSFTFDFICATCKSFKPPAPTNLQSA